MLEPARRDSAAAMAVAAVVVERLHPGAVMMALAADHVVLDTDVFRQSVRAGLPAAEAGKIVVFGLVPTEPKTAYGYIRPGAPLADDPDLCAVGRLRREAGPCDRGRLLPRRLSLELRQLPVPRRCDDP